MDSTTTERVTAAGIKEAIEGRDGRRLAGFYGDDAEVTVIDRNNPPSRPRDIRGPLDRSERGIFCAGMTVVAGGGDMDLRSMHGRGERNHHGEDCNSHSTLLMPGSTRLGVRPLA